jgi:hypothetical protein
MKINEVTKKIEPSKPRNFVAKNATTGGAGQHKDKAKTIPRKEKHKGKQFDMSEDGEPMKIAAVNGNDITLDQGGHQIKTTADALTPGQQPGSFSMKPTDPSQIKPGAVVTSDQSMGEEEEEELLPVAPDDNGIHTEKDVDLMGSRHNGDVGGDATDRFISQVTDKPFDRAQRGGRNSVVGGREGLAGRAKLGENDDLNKMLTIAGLR